MAWFGQRKRHRVAAKKRYVRTVKKVIDGDTFVINRKIDGTNKVRLAGYNAPEPYQFGGRRATNRLKGHIGGKKISVRPFGRSYDRVVANVTQNRKKINKRMKY